MRGTDLSELWLIEPLGERPLAPSDLPLTVGGPGAAIVIPGCAAGEIRARVHVVGSELRVSPETGRKAAMDGVSIALEERDGRRAIVVRHGGVANVTRPPEFEGQPFEAAAGAGRPATDRGACVSAARQGGRATARAVATGAGSRSGARSPWPLLVLGFMMTSTTVVITTSPQADLDDVEFGGTLLDFGFKGSYLVPPGEYELQVEAKGFAPARMPVKVGRVSEQRVVVALEKLPGTVDVRYGRYRRDAFGGRCGARQAAGRIRTCGRHARAPRAGAALCGPAHPPRGRGRRRAAGREREARAALCQSHA